jgi:hypothetical protein
MRRKLGIKPGGDRKSENQNPAGGILILEDYCRVVTASQKIKIPPAEF